MIADLVHDALHDAHREAWRRIRAGQASFACAADLDRHIAETATDLAVEREPKLLNRINRERLVEMVLIELPKFGGN